MVFSFMYGYTIFFYYAVANNEGNDIEKQSRKKCITVVYASLKLQTNPVSRDTKRHPGEKPHECVVCTYKPGNKTHLTRHTKTHTGETFLVHKM